MNKGTGDTESSAVEAACPISGLPVVRRPEWTDVRLDKGYRTSVEVIGDHILRSIPTGYATRAGVVKANVLHRKAIEAAVDPEAPHVHVADYSGFKGASTRARRIFAEDLRSRSGLVAVFVHDASPLFTLSIKLGRRFLGLSIPVEMVGDRETATWRAIEVLRNEGVDGLPDPGDRLPTESLPESGTLDLDGYRVTYEIIDRHILHSRVEGYLDLKATERHFELVSMVIANLDRSGAAPILVFDASGLDGVSTAARRRYLALLRRRQKSQPISLFLVYGANPGIRRAINISRPFAPFKVRTAPDRATALAIARRETRDHRGAVDRIKKLLFPKEAEAVSTEPDHIEDLLRLMARIEWEVDGPLEVDWPHSPDHPLATVVDALELIKADISELFRTRKNTEEALRKSEERYRRILDSIVDGYYEIDLAGRLLFCNDALLRIFGSTRAQATEVDSKTLMDADNRRVAVETFERVYRTRQPAHASNWEMFRRDGSTIIIETSISLITDPDGEAIGFRGIIRDITERVQTAREKADLEVQLQRSQRMEAIGTLAGGIAHNFNNLLMGIQGNISLLLREHAQNGPLVDRLETVEALVEGGSKLTAQLLGYARSGRVDVRVIELNNLVLETAETFSLTRREYRIHTDLLDRPLPIEVDPTQIEQALLNLLINAADAMPRGGDITISSRLVPHSELQDGDFEVEEGDHAVVSVEDNGCGMDAETMEHIFEPFFTTKGLTGGTGLGLASTYGIIRAHGGQIQVTSAVGSGSVFSFAFPVATVVPEPLASERTTPIQGEGTILVIEDDAAVLDACSAMLRMLNYTPISVASGEAAIDIYSRKKDEIDLVILDLILSDIGGAEVFDAIRAVDSRARVLLASGYSLDGDAARLMDRGCDDFIQKPFTMEQLSRKLEALLRRE